MSSRFIGVLFRFVSDARVSVGSWVCMDSLSSFEDGVSASLALMRFHLGELS